MFSPIRNTIIESLKGLGDLPDAEVLVETPSDESFGELYTNAAMVFAKPLRMAPKILAETICEALKNDANVHSASVAMPGFVNIRMKKEFWQKVIDEILTKRCDFSLSTVKKGSKINVEYVSANPTGPLHAGHARNAVLGDVTCNLLEKVGYEVVREFYVNDQGNQITQLARSVFLRYKELLGENISSQDFAGDMYCGDYIKDIAQALFDEQKDGLLHASEQEIIPYLREFSIKRMLSEIECDLKEAGIVMDIYTSESALHNAKTIEKAVEILERRGDIYVGVLPRPMGIADDEEWEEKPQTLFRATKYGDDIDRVIRKADGTWTYFAGDLAYHYDKIRRGFTGMIVFLGADHGGYTKRLQAAVKALSDDSASLEVRTYQLVNFLENGHPTRMSKRAGNFITMREIIEKAGKDVMRFMLVSRSHDSVIDFDFATAFDHVMSNPLFYVQYAYARICSVFRNYESSFDSAFGSTDDPSLLAHSKDSLVTESETLLMRELALWPRRIESAAFAIEPHRIVTFLLGVSERIHSWWTAGTMHADLRFLVSDSKEQTLARLSLLRATQIVLEDGMNILGVEPMATMCLAGADV